MVVAMVALILTLVGLGLGLGIGFLKFIPKQVTGIISIVATIVVAVMLWNFLGLPAVELLDRLTGIAWIFGLALGFIAGERIGALL